MSRSARYQHNIRLLETAIVRLAPALAATVALCACNSPSSPEIIGTVEQHLCPDGPCPKPDPKKDPPPPPPTYYYPAAGWSMVTASEQNAQRGVGWWAYAWNGYDLNVKAYYPQDFGTGIAVGSEPAHAFVTFHVTSPSEWSANSKLLLPTTAPWGEFYYAQQTAYVRSFITDDGVVQQLISWGSADCVGEVCTTHENYGIYQDDGTGAVLIQGTSDVAQASAAQAVLGFLSDYNSAGGSLLPPGATFDNPCADDDCSNAPIQKYLNRKAQFQALQGGDPCLQMGVGMMVCGANIILAAFWPPAWIAVPITCGIAADRAIDCTSDLIGGRSSKGACAQNTGPQVVTGPDGTGSQIDWQLVNREHCDI